MVDGLNISTHLVIHHGEGCRAAGALLYPEAELPPRLVHLVRARLQQPEQVHRDDNLEPGPVNFSPVCGWWNTHSSTLITFPNNVSEWLASGCSVSPSDLV